MNYIYFKWMGAMNIRKVVESYILKADKESHYSQNIQELDKKLEKLLLTNENKNNPKKEE